jgi:hypothetical protein
MDDFRKLFHSKAEEKTVSFNLYIHFYFLTIRLPITFLR